MPHTDNNMLARLRRDDSTNEVQDGGEILDKSLLVVDDDRLFCDRLALALSSRGFTARTAISVPEALETIRIAPPAFAVIDLRLGDGSGLDVIRALKAERADARGVILTGYGAIATAVTAVKIGAFDYLAKPANADDVVVALMAGRLDMPTEHEPPMSADRVRWEHIQRIFEFLRAQRVRDGAADQYAQTNPSAHSAEARAEGGLKDATL